MKRIDVFKPEKVLGTRTKKQTILISLEQSNLPKTEKSA